MQGSHVATIVHAHNPVRRLLATVACAMLAGLGSPAQALTWPAWLSSFQTPAAGGNGLAEATAALKALPSAVPAVAAHVTPEGHWQFVNRAGETYTAGTAGELKRAAGVLMPEAQDGFAGATLVLSLDSLFVGREAVKEMPLAKTLRAAVSGEALEIQRLGAAGLAVAIRPNVSLMAVDLELFAEGLAQLKRPLDAKALRVLSATAGAPSTLPAAPKFDAAQGGATIDAVDPDRIGEALGSIPHQTAIVTARVDGANLTIAPASGPERTLALVGLAAAARAADVDLIVLQADPPRQPGGRNWLWQRVAVSGLDHARKRETFADFLDALAQGRGVFAVSITGDGEGRVTLTASPVAAPLASSEGVTAWLRQAADAVAGQVTGAVAPAAVHARLVSDARRRELASRLLPGLPSSAQLIYFGSSALGLLALPVALGWWRRLWPQEARSEYDSRRGYVMARMVRGVAFLALFLPLAALPAFAASIFKLVARTLGPKTKAAVS